MQVHSIDPNRSINLAGSTPYSSLVFHLNPDLLAAKRGQCAIPMLVVVAMADQDELLLHPHISILLGRLGTD